VVNHPENGDKMLYTQIETHTVVLRRTMEIDAADIEQAGITQEDLEVYLNDPVYLNDTESVTKGFLISDEIHDICRDLVFSVAEERDCEEDWLSDRKGFTEIKWELEE
jgi:hypothetical protein